MSQSVKEGTSAELTRRVRLRENPDLRPVWLKLDEVLEDVLRHSGFGEIKIDVRLLKRGHKEVIIACGKQYRFVVAVPENETPLSAEKGGEAEG